MTRSLQHLVSAAAVALCGCFPDPATAPNSGRGALAPESAPEPQQPAPAATEPPAGPPLRFAFGTAPTGDGGSGFGILAEYGEGGPRRVIVTRRTPYDDPAHVEPDYFRGWGALCSLRVYDPDGILAAIVEMGEQTERERTWTLDVPPGRAGTWRVSVSGGFRPAGRVPGDEFDVEVPAPAGAWGVRGEKRLFLRDTSPFANGGYMSFSPDTDLFYLTGRGVEWSIGGAPVAGETGHSVYGPAVLAHKPDGADLLRLDFAHGGEATLFTDGMPGLVSPTPDMARTLRGGLIQASNGLWLEGPLQVRAMELALEIARSGGLDLPPGAPPMPPLPDMPANFDENFVTDPDSPALGFSLPPDSPFRTLPHDMFHNHNTYYSPGRLAELATGAAMASPAPPDAPPPDPVALRRAIVNGLATLARMDGAGIMRGMDVGDTRPLAGARMDCASSFEFMHGLGRGYAAIRHFLTPEQDRIYREGVLQVADKEMGFISYQSNQMMHVLEGYSRLLEATGEPRLHRALRIQLPVFLRNGLHGKHGQTEAGFFSEEFGPDGNYDQMSLAPLVRMFLAYRRRADADPALVAAMRAGIEKDLRFRTLFAIPDPATPEGTPYQLAYAMNHRTDGPSHFDSHRGLEILSATGEFPLAKALAEFGLGGESAPAREPLVFEGFPEKRSAGFVDLPGFAAVRRGPWYALHFWKVYDNKPDGFLGPMVLWHEKAGIGLCGLKHSHNRQTHWFGRDMDERDITFPTVYGRLDGALFVPSRTMRKTLRWDEPGKTWTVTGIRESAPPPGAPADVPLARGTIRWSTSLADDGAVWMDIAVDVPGLENAVVNLPFLDQNGRTVWTRDGSRPWTLNPGVFTQQSPGGMFRVTFPRDVRATVADNLSGGRGWTMALRLAVPPSGRVRVRMEAK